MKCPSIETPMAVVRFLLNHLFATVMKGSQVPAVAPSMMRVKAR